VAIVLILFIIVTAVLVGQLHPGSSAEPSSSGSTTTTSATTSTTAAGGAATTTTTRSGTGSRTTTTSTTVPPASVAVLVANGSSVTGAATKVATQLHANGWNTLTPVNSTADVTSTTVYYAPGYQPSASAIAESMGLTPTDVAPLSKSAPVASTTGADVVVVVGPDVAAKTTVVTPTTTTVAPVTTTTKAK
jgi:hypothetical protein